MNDTVNIYFSLDEARAELSRRRQNTLLRAVVEAELGECLWPELRERPRSLFPRHLLTPNNTFLYFLHAAYYVGAIPFAGEFLGDIFSHSNMDKQLLGRLRATNGTRKVQVEIISFSSNDRKKICEVVKHTGKRLVDFHHRLLEIGGYNIEHRDMTDWFRGFGKPTDFYYPILLHFVAHGVLFENYLTEKENKSEGVFTNNVVFPAMRRIKDKFGLRPLVVRLCPENQSEEENFYWKCYPPRVNEYILNYSRENNLPMREIE